MAIAASDGEFYLSVKTGAAGNSTTSTGAGSLGKYISTTAAPATLHGIFDVVSGDENSASEAEYRCLFYRNSHGTLTMQGAVLWISAETAGGAVGAISVDTTAASVIGSASAQAKEVTDENTAPSSQTFTAPTTKGTGLVLGDIPAGQCKAFWVRRTAANTAALDADGLTLSVAFDTAA